MPPELAQWSVGDFFFFTETIHQHDKPLKTKVYVFLHSALTDVGFEGTVTAPPHPSLEGISTPWVCDQESRQHPILLDTKPDKMTAAVLNSYGSFFSSGTQ